jgi:hypothetical protein
MNNTAVDSVSFGSWVWAARPPYGLPGIQSWANGAHSRSSRSSTGSSGLPNRSRLHVCMPGWRDGVMVSNRDTDELGYVEAMDRLRQPCAKPIDPQGGPPFDSQFIVPAGEDATFTVECAKGTHRCEVLSLVGPTLTHLSYRTKCTRWGGGKCMLAGHGHPGNARIKGSLSRRRTFEDFAFARSMIAYKAWMRKSFSGCSIPVAALGWTHLSPMNKSTSEAPNSSQTLSSPSTFRMHSRVIYRPCAATCYTTPPQSASAW